MILANPVTITPPSITRADGTVKEFGPITLSELDLTILDNAKRKSVMVQIRPCPRPMLIWEGEAYTNAGDYTQAQVEAKVSEMLGSDPKSAIEGLFTLPAPRV